MQVTVKTKNLELTDALKSYAEKKLKKVDKYFGNIHLAEVMMSTERNRHIVEITVHANGMILRGEGKTDDMYSCVDLVMAKLEKQLRKHKDKVLTLHRVPKENFLTLEGGYSVKVKGSRKKRSRKARIVELDGDSLAVLSREDAAASLEKEERDFLVFRNRESNQMNVIYKGDSGEYVLVAPTL